MQFKVEAHEIQECGKNGKVYHEGDTAELDFAGPGNADGRMALWLKSGAIVPVQTAKTKTVEAQPDAETPAHTPGIPIKKE